MKLIYDRLGKVHCNTALHAAWTGHTSKNTALSCDSIIHLERHDFLISLRTNYLPSRAKSKVVVFSIGFFRHNAVYAHGAIFELRTASARNPGESYQECVRTSCRLFYYSNHQHERRPPTIAHQGQNHIGNLGAGQISISHHEHRG